MNLFNIAMGNQESSTVQSDNEVPQRAYNYHEEVLREAQMHSGVSVSATDLNLSAVVAASHLSDDEFYSADEGESVGSITPPRTRDESDSAGERSSEESDDGHSDENEDDNGNSEDENGVASAVETSVDAGDHSRKQDEDGFLVPQSPPRGSGTTKSCGQCNVSVFQEYDSIGPELDQATAGDGSSPRLSVPSNRSRRSSLRSSNRLQQNLAASDSEGRQGKPSPFKPIFSPSHGSAQSTSDALILAAQADKRKSQSASSPPGHTSPKRLTRSTTSQRKRLGIFDDDSSDSENEVPLRKLRKRGRLSKEKIKEKEQTRQTSQKRSKSGSNSSDGKKARKKGKRSRSYSDSGSSPSETDEPRRSCRNLRSSRRKHKHSEEDSSSDSDSSDRARRRSKRRLVGSSAERDRGRSRQKRRSRSGESDENFHSDCSGDMPSLEQSIHPEVKKPGRYDRLRVGAYNPVASKRTADKNQTIPIRSVVTEKMGDQGIRNEHGKVLPLRQPVQTSLQALQPNVTAGNIMEKRRSDHSAFVRTDSNMYSQAGGAMQHQVNSNSNESHYSPSTRSAENSDQQEHDTNTSLFKNFALIPPSVLMEQGNGSAFEQARQDRDEAVYINMDSDNDVIMMDETIAAPLDVEQGLSPSLGINTSPLHSFISPRSKAVADRFKNFWSGKKKLGSNLKSFFGKSSRKSPPTPPRSLPSQGCSPTDTKSSFLGSSPQAGNSPFSLIIPSLTAQKQSTKQRISPILNTSSQSQRRILTASAKRSHTPNSAFGGETPTSQPRSSPRLSRHAATSTPVTSVVQTPSARSPVSLHLASTDLELLPQTEMYQVLHFHAGGIEVSISLGNIADQSTAAIVNWTDGALTHTVTQCSRDIAAKAGALMRAGCHDYLENKGTNLEAPDVLITPAGGRFDHRVEALVHVTAPSGQQHKADPSLQLQALVEVNVNCLRYTEEKLGLDSLSVPLIGQNIFPDDDCVQAFLSSLLVFLAEHSLTTPPLLPDLKFIDLVIPDARTTDFAADFLSSQLNTIISQGIEPAVSEAYSHYKEQSNLLRKRNIVTQNAASLSSSNSLSESPDRTTAGRPKIKRPRL